MLNSITMIGRLCADPELRHTQNRVPMCIFTLAVERDYGEKQADFIDCVAWKSTAEFVHRYFRKGSLAAVQGRLQLREWTDGAGALRRSAEVLASQVYFASRRTDAQDAQDAQPGAAEDGDGGALPF